MHSHLLNAIVMVKENKLSLEDLELWAEILDVRDDVTVVADTEEEPIRGMTSMLCYGFPALNYPI